MQATAGRGKIVKAGQAIWYLLGLNEKCEYPDYYSSHRMTSDSYVHVYASGEKEVLTREVKQQILWPALLDDIRITIHTIAGAPTIRRSESAEQR